MTHNKCPHCGHYENNRFEICPSCGKSTEDGYCPACQGSGRISVGPNDPCGPGPTAPCSVCHGSGKRAK